MLSPNPTPDHAASQATLAPLIHRLPPEVIGAILLAALHLPQCVKCRPHRSENSHLPDHVVFSHVCSVWRELVLDTPRMWAVIRVRLPFQTDPVDCLLAFLDRSRNFPLDIAVISRQHSESPIANTSAVTALILPHLHRVRSLLIDSSSAGNLQRLHTPFSNARAPILERLQLYGPRHFNHRCRNIPIFSSGAPSLMHLTMRGGGIGDIGQISPHPRSVNFSGPIPYPLSLKDVLIRFSDLTELTLGPSASLESSMVEDVITLPRVRTLRLRDMISWEAGNILQYLALPALEHLELALLLFLGFPPSRESHELLEGLSSGLLPVGQVRMLKLTNGTPAVVSAADIAPILPSVTDLVVIGPEVELFLETLTTTSEDTRPFWEQLSTLTVGLTPSLPTVQNVLATRERVGVPIQQLRITDQFAMLHADQLWKLRERVSLQVTSASDPQRYEHWDDEDGWVKCDSEGQFHVEFVQGAGLK